MALLYVDGFDAGDYALRYQGYVNFSSSTTTRFGTGRSIEGQSLNASSFYKVFTASDTIVVGFALQPIALSGAVFASFGFYGDNAGTLHLSLAYNTGNFYLYRGGYGGTLITSSVNNLFTANNWYYLEMKVKINDTTGIFQLRVNGNQVLDYSGDTKNGGTATLVDTFGFSTPNQGGHRFDDLYILDTTGSTNNNFLGDVRVHTMSPSAAGASTGFTPSSGANYTTVDELPYSATDYVSANTSTTRDTYTMADLPASATTIFGVQTNVIAKKTDAGAIALRPVTRSGGTNYYGSTVTLGTNDVSLRDLREVDPSTSTTWTSGGVNGMEAGMEIA